MKQVVAFTGALLIALILSWPIVRMAETIRACGWMGLLYECRIVVPKEPEDE